MVDRQMKKQCKVLTLSWIIIFYRILALPKI